MRRRGSDDVCLAGAASFEAPECTHRRMVFVETPAISAAWLTVRTVDVSMPSRVTDDARVRHFDRDTKKESAGSWTALSLGLVPTG
jgi:hypothetical protein